MNNYTDNQLTQNATEDLAESLVKVRSLAASPETWLEHALQLAGAGWQSGCSVPAAVGDYERFFTDGLTVQHWDGASWLSADGKPHWRQQGQYPAWRKRSSH